MSQLVAVVDPGSGNLASVGRALRHAALDAGVEAEIRVTTEAADVLAADRVVLPGQGAFAACRRGLDALPGMVEALERRVRRDAVPFLGICVGMQLMAARGLEHGETPGLGWLPGDVAPMAVGDLPLPQMGWNTLALAQPGHPLFAGLEPAPHAYFVHSYALTGGDAADIAATTDYAGPRVAIVARGNMAGTQFHVEKSQHVGLRMLANFLRWKP
ncbi:imidazole glycerol phosphate synthase subunit HisH [Roseomonas sp. NAR14]|uniref:Imidazole glycerol phosphate synthase subunit HisH n=1 Tax=Roseomonas acroporae TaxID=2937791 RepID=A0A9X1YBX8_9PROT|nr:imidazole glycerol phosphate synthase subunit HisH [Roseomonas acroporae]MCK8787296.1 imidazole glycerol phosphate synthase subunit HisH [Roseomonas acroporae]